MSTGSAGRGGFGPDPDRPIHLAVGLGDPERERRLLPALTASGALAIAERCLSGDQLLALDRAGVDALLVAFDLHRLSGGILAELARSGLPLIVLAPDAGWPGGPDLPGTVLPLESDPDAVRRAIEAAVRGEGPRPVRRRLDAPPRQAAEPAHVIDDATGHGTVIAVAGGHGSPGRTTLAVGLAAALGAVAPTVLVDADLAAPSVAAHLDADPTRNLYLLAHAEPAGPREWERALEQETQPLAARSPQGRVLCGVPKAELRAGITPRFFERLLGELRRRHRYVVLDLGAEALGGEAVATRAGLDLADRVLCVVAADLVGLWRGRTALGRLAAGPDRRALVINRHDRRRHHARSEIEWALGVPAAAVIPHDDAGAQRALLAQRPIVLDPRSRAGRACLDLAERLHGGQVLLPPETPSGGRLPRLRRAIADRWPRRRRSAPGAAAPTGASHDERTPLVR